MGKNNTTIKNLNPALEPKAVFEQYKNKVYGLAFSLTKNDKDAEDIVQNTFLKVIKNLVNFKNRSHLSTWIYKIAYNESLLYLRKRQKQIGPSNYIKDNEKQLPQDLVIDGSRRPDQQLLDKEFKDYLDKTIKSMHIKYRIPLILNKQEGLSIKNISAILGLKVNSVKTRLRRARLNIKENILGYLKDKEAKELKSGRKCGILLKFIYDYVEGRLGLKGGSSFKKHIKDCSSCNVFLNKYSKAVSITKALECQDIPLELKKRIEKFFFKKKS